MLSLQESRTFPSVFMRSITVITLDAYVQANAPFTYIQNQLMLFHVPSLLKIP